MTTFQIPEGKVVDRIELAAGEGKATINIIYKEDRPKEKTKAFAVVSTDQPTCVYLDMSENKLTTNFPNFSARDYIPVKLADANEFVIIPRDSLFVAMSQLKEQLRISLLVDKDCAKAWDSLVLLFGTVEDDK